MVLGGTSQHTGNSPFVRAEGEFCEKLLHLGSPVTYQAGSIIYQQGEHSRYFFYLRKGRVKVCIYTCDGLEKILAIHEPKSTFGESAAFDSLPYFATAVAIDDCEVYRFLPGNVMPVITENPAVALHLLCSVIRKLRLCALHIEDMTFLDAPGRVAHILAKLATDYGVPTSKGKKIQLRLTHQDLANVAGSSRVTVTKVLGQLRQRGIIDGRKRQIIVRDERGLQEWIGLAPTHRGSGHKRQLSP